MRVRTYVLVAAGLLLAGCADSSPIAAQPAASVPQGGTTAVLATVDGTPITEQDVRAALGGELAKAETEVFELKRRQLDALIADRLIAAEATRRNVSPEALLAAEVDEKLTPVTDADISAFIAANQGRIRGDAEALRPQIRQYLAEQQRAARREALVLGLRDDAEVTVALTAPAPFRATLELAGAPVRGAVDAPVTIVEFSDFHCPFCRSVQPTLTTLLERYPGKVRLVYKHLPLDALHPQARRASEASWCAAQQGKFWEFHDAIYRSGSSDASDATIDALAAPVGLDLPALKACLASGAAATAVAEDLRQGQERLGLTGTPGFFINGRELTGAQPLEAFTRIIDEELASQP